MQIDINEIAKMDKAETSILFKSKLKEAKLTIGTFSMLIGLPRGTIAGWLNSSIHAKVPYWAFFLLQLYAENKELREFIITMQKTSSFMARM